MRGQGAASPAHSKQFSPAGTRLGTGIPLKGDSLAACSHGAMNQSRVLKRTALRSEAQHTCRVPCPRGLVRQKCAVVPRRARIRGSYTLVSLSLRLKDLLGPVTRVKKKEGLRRPGRWPPRPRTASSFSRRLCAESNTRCGEWRPCSPSRRQNPRQNCEVNQIEDVA